MYKYNIGEKVIVLKPFGECEFPVKGKILTIKKYIHQNEPLFCATGLKYIAEDTDTGNEYFCTEDMLGKLELNCIKYKDEISELLENGDTIAVVDGQPKPCHEVECMDCSFDKKEKQCCKLFADWLYNYYIPFELKSAPTVQFEKDELVEVSMNGSYWTNAYYAYKEDDKYYVYPYGRTSKTTYNTMNCVSYKYIRKHKEQ